MNNLLEKDFENTKKDDEIEIVLKDKDLKNEIIVTRGRVTDNDKRLKELYMIEVSDEDKDTTIRYDQIKSVKIFNLQNLDI